MKKIFLLILSVLLVGVLSPHAMAEDTQPTEAKVLKITGTSAQVKLANGETRALQVGESLPEGATIITGAGTDVYLTPIEGTVSTIKENSTVSLDELSITRKGGVVTAQTATLNLQSGDLVSSLDPKKKNINHYGVRTPKGVAAARGTVYTVSVQGVSYTVVTGTGRVSITPTEGNGTPVLLEAGKVSISGGAAADASSLTPAQQATVNNAMAIAVAALAVVADNAGGTFGEASAGTASAEMAETMATVVKSVPGAVAQAAASAAAAAPNQAGAVVTAAINAAAANGQDVSQVAQTVAQAAAQGAASKATSPAAAAAVAQTVANAAAKAAATAAPGQATAIAQAVAQSAAQGASQGANLNPTQSQAAANAAASGAASGASAGSGTTVEPPSVTAPTPPAVPVITTPITPIDPGLVSPSS